MSDYRDVTDGFHMSALEFHRMWKLTEREINREFYSGRLQVHGKRTADGGYEDLRISLPSLRAWLAREAEMPPRVRRKIREAGGAERVDRFRREQMDLCEIDPFAGTVTLPDGTVWRDIMVGPTVKN